LLVLSRKLDEELLINGCIQVRVLSIDGGRVRLGITAPNSVPIIRRELTSVAAQIQRRPPKSPRSDIARPAMMEVHYDSQATI